MKGRDMRLFELIRSFRADYLPKRRNYGANTVRSYRTELDQFLMIQRGQSTLIQRGQST